MHDIDKQLDSMLRGDFKTGWEISEKLQAIGPENITDSKGQKNPEMWLRHNFNRGWFLLQQGKYQEGSQLIESGRFLNVYGSGYLKTSAPIYNPEKDNIKGKSIIISLEGGYGDEIIHARFATSFKKLGADKVYLAAAPETCSIFSRIEGVDGVILRDQAHTVKHDFWVPGFSAGWLAGHTYENLPNGPYLTALPQSIEIWRTLIQAPEGKKKVGIRWAGNPKFEHQQFRRFEAEFLINLAKYDELKIYSLQRDHNLQKLPENIMDLQYFLIGWEDTLAALANMDLVITSCTSIAHAAAALGKETWVITPILPYHTWTYNAPESKTSPYYQTATIYRQKEAGIWNDTFQELYADLEKRFALKHIDLPSCDREYKKANLGCGFKKLEGYDNYDISPLCKPDKILDMDQKTWDIPDNTYDHIVAIDVLEHMDDFINTIKEMYRISKHGAIWEIQIPHWRSDLLFDDPTHKNSITIQTFRMFDAEKIAKNIQSGRADSYFGIDLGVDIEVCEFNLDILPSWKQKFAETKASQEEIDFAVNFYNNIVQTVKILIQVHKDPRYSKSDFERIINERLENSKK